MQLTTERLILQSLTIEDAHDIFSLTSDKRVTEFMSFDTHESIEQAIDYVNDYLNCDNTYPFTIHRKIDNTFIGFYSIKKCEDYKDGYSQTVFLGSDFWNNGYNQEILQAGIEFAKNVLGADALYGYIVEINKASIACALKYGYKQIDSLKFDDYPHLLNVYKLSLQEKSFEGSN